jgi:hypothetical protein
MTLSIKLEMIFFLTMISKVPYCLTNTRNEYLFQIGTHLVLIKGYLRRLAGNTCSCKINFADCFRNEWHRLLAFFRYLQSSNAGCVLFNNLLWLRNDPDTNPLF